MREEWRCASMISGELSVDIAGMLQMLLWFATSLVTVTLEVSSLSLIRLCTPVR